MTYKILATKWRPKNFSDVVGQEHVLEALINSFSLGRIHHSYIFSGIRGVGKTTIARILAKCFSCEVGISSIPCNLCNNCLAINQGKFVDLVEIDAASRTKVEEMRDLLDNIQYAPMNGRFKIYLIDEIHMLSRHSFNALLKTLEEPPSHIKFLFATTELNKIPATVLSRCMKFYLKKIKVNQIYEKISYILSKEKIFSEPGSLEILSRSADGSMRDALSLTDQAIALCNGNITNAGVNTMIGISDSEYPLCLIETLVKGDGEKLIKLLNKLELMGYIDWEILLIDILRFLHHILIIQLLPKLLVNTEENDQTIRLNKLAEILSPNDLQLYYQIILMGRKDLPLAPNYRMGIDITLLRALAFTHQN
ncbi:DNA polymerase III subunit gamma/tau [Pantoea sp. SoEX]|nr:DNA polymerase III subunit gamma/tau [Pantoea sp. SoEX]